MSLYTLFSITSAVVLIGAMQGRAVDISVDFENRSTGQYTKSMMRVDFNGLNWSNGLDQGRGRIVENAAGNAGKSLQVMYPEGQTGASNSSGGGIQFKCDLGGNYEAAYAKYRIMFQDGFEFVKGGKLPGLCGGRCNTGGEQCTGADGWSARYMWRRGGQAVIYLYDLYMNDYGVDIALNHPELFYFEPGVWYTLKQYVKMNDPERRNGVIKVWVDDEAVLDYRFAKFRTTENLAIDLFYFSTFFGGSGRDWAPVKDEYVYFDEFEVWEADEAPIAETAGKKSGNTSIHTTASAIRICSPYAHHAKLYNSRGVLVASKRFGSSQTGMLEVGSLPPGAYRLRLSGGDRGARAYPVIVW